MADMQGSKFVTAEILGVEIAICGRPAHGLTLCYKSCHEDTPVVTPSPELPRSTRMFHVVTRPTMTLPIRPVFLACALAAALAVAPVSSRADDRVIAVPQPEGVVALTSTATLEVPKDWMSLTFSTSRDGPDAAAVQVAVRDALDAALAQARKVAKGEGHVEVQTGAFALQPRLNARGVPVGWSGRAELVVQGRDMGTIAELAGRVTTLTIAHVEYTISREAREKAEGELSAQAIARFRAKAADFAKAFGYGGFTVREVSVATESNQSPIPRAMAMMKAIGGADAEAALPVEAGKGTVTTTVSGTVQMK
jgi:predicted secreted protein